jgi:hypothetical protein
MDKQDLEHLKHYLFEKLIEDQRFMALLKKVFDEEFPTQEKFDRFLEEMRLKSERTEE